MRKDVEEAIKKFNVKTFGNKKRIEKVQDVLNENETVHYISPTNAIILNLNTKQKSKVPGIFVLTDKRFIFRYKALLNETVDVVDIDKIQATNCHGNSIMGGHIEIHTIVKTYDILVTYKKEVMKEIQTTIDNVIHQYNQASNQSQVVQTSDADEILKYKNLLDKGIITQDEFNAKKGKLLDL